MMKRASFSMLNDFDEILLVGGASKILQVRKHLQAEYNKPIVMHEPKFIVAKGAVIAARDCMFFKKIYF